MNSDHTITRTRVVVAVLSTAMAIVLSACGGGGAAQTTGVENPTVSLSNLDSTGRSNAITAVEKASAAKPVAGSVTQSSNTNFENITVDKVEVTVQYGANGPSFDVRNGASWTINSQDGNPQPVIGVPSPYKGVVLSKRISAGLLFVNVYADIEAPKQEPASESDADYLAGGLWLIVPDNVSSIDDFVFGAFADGNDPFEQSKLQALTGTANYQGNAAGLYTYKDPEEELGGFFDASISLTAAFGASDALGTIDGSVTDISVDGEPISGSLTLNPADIGTSNSGFFRGTLTGSAEGITEWAGNWGGQFFGNGASASDSPGSVAGTLGGKGSDSSNSASVSFTGFFGAYKQ